MVCWRDPRRVELASGFCVAAEQERGSRMAQVVPADREEACTFWQRLGVAVGDLLSVQRGTLACGENEVRIFRGAPCSAFPGSGPALGCPGKQVTAHVR
jgi:hypothetical protein